MPLAMRALQMLPLTCVLSICAPLHAQLPFYTDDTGVTEPGKWHFEFFNEYDALQLQYPNLRQNTANFKLNYGLPHGLEVDLDAPYLAINRAPGNLPSTGLGDTNLGIKWSFHKESRGSWVPALAASLYIELPTGDARQQLGSGLADYWLNSIGQKSISDKTRITGNIGFLFAGNTSTGVIGTLNTRGHVYTGGLSLLHDFTSQAHSRRRALWRLCRQRKLGQKPASGHGWRSIRNSTWRIVLFRPARRQICCQPADWRPGRSRDGFPRRLVLRSATRRGSIMSSQRSRESPSTVSWRRPDDMQTGSTQKRSPICPAGRRRGGRAGGPG